MAIEKILCVSTVALILLSTVSCDSGSGVQQKEEVIQAEMLIKASQVAGTSEVSRRLISEAEALLDDLLGSDIDTHQQMLALRHRASIHLATGRTQEAVIDLTSATELRPNDVASRAMRADAYELLGRYEESMNDWNQVIAMASDDSGLYAQRDRLHFQLGQFDLAISDLTRELESGATSTVWLEMRADAHVAMGNWEFAVEDLRAAIRDLVILESEIFGTTSVEGFNPMAVGLQLKIAELLEQAGRHSAAREEYKKVLTPDYQNEVAVDRFEYLRDQ